MKTDRLATKAFAGALGAFGTLLLAACQGEPTSNTSDAGLDAGTDAGFTTPWVSCLWGSAPLPDGGPGYEYQAVFQEDLSIVCPGPWAYVLAPVSRGVPGPFSWGATTYGTPCVLGGTASLLWEGQGVTGDAYDGLVARVVAVNGIIDPRLPDGGYSGMDVNERFASFGGVRCREPSGSRASSGTRGQNSDENLQSAVKQ